MRRSTFLALLLAGLAGACTSSGHGSCPPGTIACIEAGATVCRASCTADVDAGSDAGSHPDSGPRTDAGPHDAGSLCMPTCSSADRCCGFSCVAETWSGSATTDGTGDSSFLNCGGCGRSCDPNTASQCAMGTVGPACECGTHPACTAPSICVNGASGYVCQADCGGAGHGPCATGTQCCGAGAAGSCVDTQTDDANCGTCGHACTATQACTAGACVDLCGGVACRAAMGSDPGQLCCADTCVPQDVMNCGGCGMMCDVSMGETCFAGASFFPGAPSVCCMTPDGPPFCPPVFP